MKNIITAASFAGFVAFSGSALGQTATSNVVGYETLGLNAGFNFVGVRLHQSPVASGDLETVNAGDVADADIDLGALMDGSTFILEIEDATGTIVEVTSSDGGTGLSVSTDLTGLGTPLDYSLRPSDTLATVFGASNEAGLATGSFGNFAAADEIWLWNGTGFDKYYYDTFHSVDFVPRWTNLNDNSVIMAEDIDIVYVNGLVINSKSGNDVVVAGDLKSVASAVTYDTGFNFVGTVAPVGATLETIFGAANEAGLATGSFGNFAAADEVWVWNGSGFDKYYYDTFHSVDFVPRWTNLNDNSVATASSVDVGSGYVLNAKANGAVAQGVPSYYSGL